MMMWQSVKWCIMRQVLLFLMTLLLPQAFDCFHSVGWMTFVAPAPTTFSAFCQHPVWLSTNANRHRVDISVTVCFLFVRLRISPPRIKLAASYFAQQFIGVQCTESPIFVNCPPLAAQNRTNPTARRPRPLACKHYRWDAPFLKSCGVCT